MIRTAHLGCLVALLLFARSGFTQVRVTVKLDRSEYLVGEPIFAILDVTNIGTEAIGHSECDVYATLIVPGGQPREVPKLRGCYWGAELGGSGCGLFPPPMMAPEKTVSYRRLLTRYRLQNGTYRLGVSGSVTYYPPVANPAPRSDALYREVGKPLTQKFDFSLPLTVRQGTEAELRQRYDRYVNEASSASDAWFQARGAIAEMAPPFLEKTILGFADRPATATLAVEGLARIATPESRTDLIHLFGKSTDPELRSLILERLAGIATAKELSFFTSLLPGHGSQLDDKLLVFAMLGIGTIGGDQAVKTLASVPPSPNPNVREAVALALGNTRSRAAVSVLIRMYGDHPESDFCNPLATLTHRQWCAEGGTDQEIQASWRAWWNRHRAAFTVYGTGQCVAQEKLLPLAR